MSDLTQKPKPNYAPTYAAAMYPELAQIARSHGYTLAVHGSLARDLDLIAIPWIEDAGEPQAIIDDILAKYAVHHIGDIGHKPHGRIAYTLSVGWGHCAIDIQFTPKKPKQVEQVGQIEHVPNNKCPECHGEKYLSERDYCDKAHCPYCDGKGTVNAAKPDKPR